MYRAARVNTADQVLANRLNHLEKLEAPPGFEPGIEVLQRSVPAPVPTGLVNCYHL
jgi:hypothetical protein